MKSVRGFRVAVRLRRPGEEEHDRADGAERKQRAERGIPAVEVSLLTSAAR